MARLIEIQFEPEHYSHVCDCTIPESWVGIVDLRGDRLNSLRHSMVMGDTPEQVLELARERDIEIDPAVEQAVADGAL